jgi:hypothetical protein
MKHLTGIALAAAFIFAGTGAMADEATNNLRCYIVSLQMIDSTNTTMQFAAIMAHGYWLGRLDNLIPLDKLEDRVVAEYAEMINPEFFKSESIRCGQEMMARGKAEAEMGKNISARGEKMMRDENTR